MHFARPNRIRRSSRRVVSLLSIAPFVLAACGGGGGSDDTQATAPPPVVTPVPVYATKTAGATVTLPTGSKVAANQLTIVDSIASVTPAIDGTFQLPAYDNGTQIAIALSPAGNPMLMGFIDATHSTLSAQSTAQVLAWYALGGMLTLNESERAQYITQIPMLQAFPALVDAVTAEIVANPDAFATANANLTLAVNTFFQAVTGSNSVTPTRVHPQGIVVSPSATSPQSGVALIETEPASAYVTNSYRRRTHVFVTRVKDTTDSDTTDSVDTPNAAAIVDFELPPTVGLAGGVTGSITDIFNAYFGNQPTAYAPQSSSPFSVPLTTGVDKTTYSIINVGPGGHGQDQIATLTPAQHAVLVQTAINGLVNDAMIPFIGNVMFGSGFLADSSNAPIAGTTSFRSALINNLEKEMLGFIPTLPGEEDKIIAGDYRGALDDLLFNVLNTGGVRTLIIKAATDAAAEAGIDSTKLSTVVDKFNVIINAAGGVLQVIDSGVYSTQLAGSDVVDTWSLVTSATKVTLSPATTKVSLGSTVVFTAAVPGADTTGFSYQWTTSGRLGSLTENGGAGRTGQTTYCSSSALANYVANASTSVSLPSADSVSVTAFTGAGCVAANALNSATASVNVQDKDQDFSLWLGVWHCTIPDPNFTSIETFYNKPFPTGNFGSAPFNSTMMAIDRRSDGAVSYVYLVFDGTRAWDVRGETFEGASARGYWTFSILGGVLKEGNESYSEVCTR